MAEETKTNTENQPQTDAEKEALQLRIQNLQKDLDSRDKKNNELQAEIDRNKAEMEALNANAGEVAYAQAQAQFQERLSSLESSNKELMIERQANSLGVPLTVELKEALKGLPQEQIGVILNNQAKQLEEVKKTTLEQRSRQDQAYLQRTGMPTATPDEDDEENPYGN